MVFSFHTMKTNAYTLDNEEFTMSVLCSIYVATREYFTR